LIIKAATMYLLEIWTFMVIWQYLLEMVIWQLSLIYIAHQEVW